MSVRLFQIRTLEVCAFCLLPQLSVVNLYPSTMRYKEDARDVSRKLSSDWRVLQIVEKREKNVFQRVSATGERDTLANTEVSLVFCVYSASPWAVRHKSISCVTSKAAMYSFYNKAMSR